MGNSRAAGSSLGPRSGTRQEGMAQAGTPLPQELTVPGLCEPQDWPAGLACPGWVRTPSPHHGLWIGRAPPAADGTVCAGSVGLWGDLLGAAGPLRAGTSPSVTGPRVASLVQSGAPPPTVSSVQMECTCVPNITDVKMRKSSASKHSRMRRITVVGGEKELHSERGTEGSGLLCAWPRGAGAHPASA